jgi:hypothetical protein
VSREELIALRDALGALMALPDSMREQLIRWFAPEAGKGNGHDPHPLAARKVDVFKRDIYPAAPPQPPKPRSASAQRLIEASEAKARADERKLIAAMRDNPGSSVIALANAAGGSRSATGERLRRLCEGGMVEKDLTGRWTLKEERKEPGPTQPPRPPDPSPGGRRRPNPSPSAWSLRLTCRRGGSSRSKCMRDARSLTPRIVRATVEFGPKAEDACARRQSR